MAESKISKKQVKHVAELCRLEISDAEVEKLSALFTDTLNYMNVIGELDTAAVVETSHVTGEKNVFSSKDNKATLKREAVLSNAGETENGLIVTKGVFDRD
ncbi:hypothetical protein A3F07_02765 [candidate division WWE3 bacterium RIFCSPHIGHO2_12_FULL_38_15]|uniref:Aspartyl/glutamyl-tRNA(Asn/Gln) amidotransferase subunit C n=1 Tax=candidate division WWE3 bacterium RIFCSPHIGHO2_02_FULL_38_14 TaxID=1802620 RepID=A0A1F4V9Z0_UNCKA|nr:MAG: hypothetical protein A2793_04390 [candidate division WWE3 bacterium RIFCSPHIGHO2_01_FULL_38_45]OGC49336.1 MAG: hypothetical protein A3F07_02765 [candidate division WWE3 bacterium RIFCSPHIGHO2_12_FULL_38_15]OGC53939.1 MAG: hypothetical protein A3B64_02870 [candidate division WWE3 bacterium RIFCSPLOWO2_01_FULL_37_24]OGC54015.1 MAG: hypothetical protein A3D91_04605 [candidate division WWE3 bacterium RIFCSPHIGHO2_02_FULL_38_14]